MVLLPIAPFCQVVFFPAIVFRSGRRWWTLPEPMIGDAAGLVVVKVSGRDARERPPAVSRARTLTG